MTIFHVLQHPDPLQSVDSFAELPPEVRYNYRNWFMNNFNCTKPAANHIIKKLLLEYEE